MAGNTEKVVDSAATDIGLLCVKCGRDVSEADAFCIYCGTKVSFSQSQRKAAAIPAPPAAPKQAPPAPAPKQAPPVPVANPKQVPPAVAAKQAPPAPAVAAKLAPTTKKSEPMQTSPKPSVKQAAPTPAVKEPKPRQLETKQPVAPKSAARPPTSGQSTAPSSASSAVSQPAPVPSAPSSTPQRRPQPVAQPPPFASRTQSDGRSNESHGRGSLDSMPSDVAGLEKLWVPDNFSNECMDCKTPFGFPKPRRHHCRVCGLLFCRPCVNHKIQVPASFGYGNAQQRCCRNCITALQMKAITTPADVFAQRRGPVNHSLSGQESYDVLGESQVRRSEADLIEQRARTLIESYKQMQAEHLKYPAELGKIRNCRSEREKPILPREAELEAAKKLIKNRNYYDRKACADFAKRFKVDKEMKEVRDVFDWLKIVIERDIKRMEKWLDSSRKERKEIENLKVKGKEINWDEDMLERIPALKEIQKKIARQNGPSHKGGNNEAKLADAVHPSEQWIVELLKFKKNISEIDVKLLKDISVTVDAAVTEEDVVNANLKKMKTDKEYVLNSIRFIDQEEAKAIRSTGKGGVPGRHSPGSESGSFVNGDEQPTPKAHTPSPKPARTASPKLARAMSPAPLKHAVSPSKISPSMTTTTSSPAPASKPRPALRSEEF
ncbi:unnamed protein product [Peronospora effusa]|nr:unnamed protein product [Peronospora effusa]